MRPKYRVAKYRGGYAVIWYDEKGKRHRRALGADKWKAHAVAGEVVDALTAPKGPRTVGQLVEDYLGKTDAIGVETMRAHWRAARSAFEMLSPRQLTEEFCREYAAGRAVRPATIRKELGVIRAALGKAKALEATVWMPPAPQPRDVRLTREQQSRLEAACRHAHLWLFVYVARYTAARPGAITALRWVQVDLERRKIDLGGSGRQKRRAALPIHPNLAWALALAKAAALSPFVIEYAGRRVYSVKKAFRAAASRADLSGITPHILRHTAASWMAERGVPMDEIAQYLGHTSPSVTFRVYARYSPEHLKKASDALA